MNEESEIKPVESKEEIPSNQRDEDIEQVRVMFKRAIEAMRAITSIGLEENNPIVRTAYLENIITTLLLTSNLCGYLRIVVSEFHHDHYNYYNPGFFLFYEETGKYSCFLGNSNYWSSFCLEDRA